MWATKNGVEHQVTLVKTWSITICYSKLSAIEGSKVGVRLAQYILVPTHQRNDGLFNCHYLLSGRYRLPCRYIFHMTMQIEFGGMGQLHVLDIFAQWWDGSVPETLPLPYLAQENLSEPQKWVKLLAVSDQPFTTLKNGARDLNPNL